MGRVEKGERLLLLIGGQRRGIGSSILLGRGSSGWSFDAAESAKLTVDVASSAKER